MNGCMDVWMYECMDVCMERALAHQESAGARRSAPERAKKRPGAFLQLIHKAGIGLASRLAEPDAPKHSAAPRNLPNLRGV